MEPKQHRRNLHLNAVDMQLGRPIRVTEDTVRELFSYGGQQQHCHECQNIVKYYDM